ncbi:hypothetical protein HYU11_06080 [Candidatus Woesearchaeota archaeon]|nr:hypothetical protein [Candidatus Woesearchaeota archaeon]
MSKPKRIGSRILDRREGLAEGPIAIAIGGTTIQLYFPKFATDLRESAYMARHAGRTITDTVQGGPEGMRGAQSLDEALRLVEAEAGKNKTASRAYSEAAAALQQRVASRKKFAESILDVYTQNETTSRVASRIAVQLKGSTKQFFEAGNDLKNDWWKQNIDGPIIMTYGKAMRHFGDPRYKNLTDDQIIAKALESSESLKQFYTEARKFYDSRQKGEEAINAFSGYLERTIEKSEADNREIEHLYPKLISMLREGYSIEDYIFATDSKGANITPKDVTGVREKVQGQQKTVTEARQGVEKFTPLPQEGTDWIAVATNPFMLALAGYVVYRGATEMMGIHGIASRIAISPIKQGLNGAHALYENAAQRIRGG